MVSFVTTVPVYIAASTFLTICSSITAFAPTPPFLTQAKMRYSVHHTTKMIYLPPVDMMSNSNKEEHKMQNGKSMNPTPALVSMSKNKFDPDKNSKDIKNRIKLTSMQLAAAAAGFTLAFMPLSNADAISGGRMGGSFSSSPPPSMSRPAPSSYSRGSSSGYISRPSVLVAPNIGYGGGYYSPLPSISPFTPRVYGGPSVISVARGPSVFDLLFVGGFLFTVSQIFLKSSTTTDDTFGEWTSSSSSSIAQSALGSGSQVVQLSVALEVSDRDDRNSILSVLNRLSQTARTDSRVGIQNLSSQVALEILRKRSSIVSASSSTKNFSNRQKVLREFQDCSIKERSKFESETVSKYGGVDYGSSSSSASIADLRDSSGSNDKATIAVITLILAIDGDSTNLNQINNIADVEQALQKIATNSKVDDCLQSAEILWTPEERSETLNKRDVIADYPELRSV